MRPKVLILALGLCLANMGCGTFFVDACRNLTEMPINGADDCLRSHRAQVFAQQAWQQYAECHLEQEYSEDYGDGFRSGYAYFLDVGNDQPPAVPPYRYRLTCYQTPAGHHAIEEWYQGFHDGAQTAKMSGLRKLFIIPLSAPPINVLLETRPTSSQGAQGSCQQPTTPTAPTPGDFTPPPPRPLETLPSKEPTEEPTLPKPQTNYRRETRTGDE